MGDNNMLLQSSLYAETRRDIVYHKRCVLLKDSASNNRQSQIQHSDSQDDLMFHGRNKSSELRDLSYENNTVRGDSLYYRRIESEGCLNELHEERPQMQSSKLYSDSQNGLMVNDCYENSKLSRRRSVNSAARKSKLHYRRMGSEECLNEMMHIDRPLIESHTRNSAPQADYSKNTELRSHEYENNVVGKRKLQHTESERRLSVNGMHLDKEGRRHRKRPKSLDSTDNNHLFKKCKRRYSEQKLNKNSDTKFVSNNSSISNENVINNCRCDSNKSPNYSLVSKESSEKLKSLDDRARKKYYSVKKLTGESSLPINDCEKKGIYEKDALNGKCPKLINSLCVTKANVPSGNSVKEKDIISVENNVIDFTPLKRKSDNVLISRRTKEISCRKQIKMKRKSTGNLVTVINEERLNKIGEYREHGEKNKTRKVENSKTENYATTKNVASNSCENLKNFNVKPEKCRRLQNKYDVKQSSDNDSEDDFEKFCTRTREKVRLKYEENINKQRVKMKEFIDDKTDDSSSIFYYNLLSSDVKKDVKGTLSCKEELKCPKNVFKVLFLKAEKDDSCETDATHAAKKEFENDDNISTNFASEQQNVNNTSEDLNNFDDSFVSDLKSIKVKTKEAENEHKSDLINEYETIKPEALNDIHDNDSQCHDSSESHGITSDHLREISPLDNVERAETEREMIAVERKANTNIADIIEIADSNDSKDDIIEFQTCSCSSSECDDTYQENSLEKIIISDDDSVIEVVDLEDPKYDVYNKSNNYYENMLTTTRKSLCLQNHNGFEDKKTESFTNIFRIYQPENVKINNITDVPESHNKLHQITSQMIHEVNHHELHGVVPQLYKVTPQIYPVTSQVHGASSNLHGVTEKLLGITSQLDGVTSQLDGVTSQLYPVTSLVHGTIPNLHGITEKLHGVTSQLYSVTSQAFEATPQLHEVTSQIRGVTPQLHKTASQMYEATPNLHITAHQSPETTPHDLPLLNFVTSLSCSIPRGKCHPLAHFYKNNFEKERNRLCIELFELFNLKVFSNKFPGDMEIEWTARLRTTAGYCWREEITHVTGEITRKAKIKLSSKVITTAARLRDTLLHEMCHAAAWIVDGYEGHHGSIWKAWASKAMSVFPEIPAIENRHDYKID